MNIADALNLGLQKHREGKLREAEEIYRKILAAQPDQPEALHLLGIVAHSAGQFAASAQLISRAVQLVPERADFHGSMGMALMGLEKRDEAIAEYRKAIELMPGLAQAHNDLGLALAAGNQTQEAIASYRRAAELAPRMPDPLYNLGNIFRKMNRPDEAIAEYTRAIALRPNWPEAHNNLALAYKLKPNFNEAIQSLQRAISLSPNYAPAWNNLAATLCDLREYTQGESASRRALQLDGRISQAHNNLGYALCGLGRYAESIPSFRTAVALEPDYGEAYGNLGNAYYNLADFEQALCMFNTALAIRPDDALSRWNRGLVHLMRGDYPRGWQDYEARQKVHELVLDRPSSDRPTWDGSELNDRRILIYTEQAVGDTFQFVRYLPMVARRGGKIVVCCHKDLIELFRIQPSVAECVDFAAAAKTDVDVQLAMPSLPGIFGTRLETIPSDVPYLRVDPAKRASWAKRVQEAAGGKRKVGLVWAGRNIPDPFRSTTLAELAEVGRVDGNWFCSLQKGGPAKQSPPPWLELTDWTAELNNFSDTASLVDCFDLIITIDTSVAHLAGALGKQTWTLLRHVPDWRWMMQRSDSPWYPTMRLFRQKQHGDWKAPIAQVVSALKAL